MSSRDDLRLDWCSAEAARFAVEHWHYSRAVPVGKLVKIGVWEGGCFIGCVLFGRGANMHIGSPYGLNQFQVCELVRIALRSHRSSVSRIMSIATKMMSRLCVDTKLVVSYADPAQGHIGAIYQAANWIYVGTTHPIRPIILDGKKVHQRTASCRFGSVANIPRATEPMMKHKYLMPLTPAMRSHVLPLAQPFPKRAGSAVSGTPDVQSGGGGATPTPALP